MNEFKFFRTKATKRKLSIFKNVGLTLLIGRGAGQGLPDGIIFLKGDFLAFYFLMYDIQHCFICHPSNFTVSEDARIEPRTVASLALTARCSNHLARSHPHLARSHG